MITRLDGSGLPFAPIGKPEELFDYPHLAEGGLEPVTLEDGTTVRLPTIPLAMDGQRIGAAQVMPSAGADALGVLAELWYDAARIDALIKDKAVGEPE